MRRYLLIFMLFLLPIRGLVGDAMAYSMMPAPAPAAATEQQTEIQSATNSGASRAIFHWAAAHFDTQTAAEPTSKHPCHTNMAAASDQDSTHNQCTSCQACHLSAATPFQLPDNLLQTSAALPQQRASLWRNADPRLLAKTPVV
jgi:hypothetical protein